MGAVDNLWTPSPQFGSLLSFLPASSVHLSCSAFRILARLPLPGRQEIVPYSWYFYIVAKAVF